MQITNVITYPLRCATNEPFAYSQKWFKHRTALLIKIETDEGIIGWGESFCHDAWPAIVALIDRVYKPLLIGQEAFSREVIWSLLYNWTRDYGQKGLTTAAMSGIDIALWDIAGKAAGLPISKLLGGNFYKHVEAYATGLYITERSMKDPVVLAEEALRYVEQGFRGIKMKVGFGLEVDVRNVECVRRTIGSGIKLMVDANHAYPPDMSIRLARSIEDLDIFWFEEPVVPEDLDGYVEVRRATNIPVAGGEAEFTRYGFSNLLTRRCVDFVQPDLCITGGISEGVKIAALASAFGTRLVPHIWGTGVALAAALQFMAAQPPSPPSLNSSTLLLELDRTENPLREESLVTNLQLSNGNLTIPTGPGLGVEVDACYLERYQQA
jgi:D-galactarolactone cycloisomerase